MSKWPRTRRWLRPRTASGEYTLTPLVNGKPQFMNKDGKPANAGGTYCINRGNAVPQGDRADIKLATTWGNGVLTSVLSRKLVTGSKFDVQFDPAKRYPFGIAAFDNAAVRHATPDDALFMVFGK